MFTTARFIVPAALLCGSTFAFAAEPLPFPNAGFEEGLASWSADQNDKANNLSRVLPEAARSGKSGLRVIQTTDNIGSWLQSARVPVEPAKTYRLEFWARQVETSGIGVWIQFYNEERQAIKSPGGDPTVQLKPGASDWERQELQLTTPAGAAFFTLAVHGYSKHVVKADFDDFTLTPVEGAPAPAAKATLTSALTPDPARVKEIAAALPAQPKGIGPSLDNRTAWNALAAEPEIRDKVLPRAGRFLNEPIPVVTAESYAASLASKDRKADRLADARR
ncbi:MAG: carbohydrate binding domain-containing protein, partial [Rariglobus sp.]